MNSITDAVVIAILVTPRRLKRARVTPGVEAQNDNRRPLSMRGILSPENGHLLPKPIQKPYPVLVNAAASPAGFSNRQNLQL